MEISTREATPFDADQIAPLSDQLGYPLAVEQISQNINSIRAKQDHNIFVATINEKIVGWVGVHHAIMLVSAPYCEINGLVVDRNYRGKGIGKLLIEKAKHWGREKGNDKLKLRCNVLRTETHLFYQHLGFKDVKKQTSFELPI
jgi:GNAT superfamily N-acetyltransferase